MPVPRPRGLWFLVTASSVVVGVVATAVYANLSHEVADPADYAWFPPFVAGYDANDNHHLGGEYLKIATALVEGRGYADPFGPPTGPTAWMPPVFTLLLAGLLWANGADLTAVSNAVVVCQTAALVATAVLVLLVARRTAPRVPPPVVAALLAAALATRFRLAYQTTHDSWLVLLAVDAVLAGAVWGWAGGRRRVVGWGVVGGLVALVNPAVAVGWAVVTLAGWRAAGRRAVLTAAAVAGLVVLPWTARNAVVFGRVVPVKSNLAYELYQAQVHAEGGRLTEAVWRTHPHSVAGPERAEYAAVGEMAFLDRRREQFWRAVAADPGRFVAKVWDRFLAAGLDYAPMSEGEYDRVTASWLFYVLHPLPTFAAVALLLVAPVRRLPPGCWAGLGLAGLYLLPYVLVSYYDRYEFPLWGVKVLLVVWWLQVLVGGKSENGREEPPPAATTG